MLWSYSRLTSFYTCPYMWYQNYITKETPQEDNFYAQYGTFIHSILEKFYRGDLAIFELVDYYIENFKNVVTKRTSEKIFNSYYESGIDYFSSFKPIKQHILGVEKEIKFKVGEYDFIGYIDLLTQDDNYNITVTDHKTAKIDFLKNGSLNKKSATLIDGYKKQLYLYSKAIIDEYGRFPKFLQWNFIRNDVLYNVPFVEKEYHETLDWCIDTIKEIENEQLFLPNIDSGFCNFICSYRNDCEYI